MELNWIVVFSILLCFSYANVDLFHQGKITCEIHYYEKVKTNAPAP